MFGRFARVVVCMVFAPAVYGETRDIASYERYSYEYIVSVCRLAAEAAGGYNCKILKIAKVDAYPVVMEVS